MQQLPGFPHLLSPGKQGRGGECYDCITNDREAAAQRNNVSASMLAGDVSSALRSNNNRHRQCSLGVGCVSYDEGVGARLQRLGQSLGQAAVVVVWEQAVGVAQLSELRKSGSFSPGKAVLQGVHSNNN